MTHHEEVTIYTSLGATVSTDIIHTNCNALIDAGGTMSSISDAYHIHLCFQI